MILRKMSKETNFEMDVKLLSRFTDDERGFLNRMSISSKIIFVISALLSLGLILFINIFKVTFSHNSYTRSFFVIEVQLYQFWAQGQWHKSSFLNNGEIDHRSQFLHQHCKSSFFSAKLQFTYVNHTPLVVGNLQSVML